MSITTRAAICFELGTPWSVEEIELDPPKAGEVLVKMAASGCATPTSTSSPATCPCRCRSIGGHEGAGVVEEVGPGVTSAGARRPRRLRLHPGLRPLPVLLHRPPEPVRPGHVHAAPACRSPTARPATTPDGQDLGLMCLLGTFAEHTVVNEASCIKIDDDIPLDMACLLGCGVVTGWGSAVYAAEVAAGRHRRRRRHRRHRHQRRPGRRSWPAPSGSSPSTRWSSSGRRRWSSAPRTPSRDSRRPAAPAPGAHLGQDGQRRDHDHGRRRAATEHRRCACAWSASAAGSWSPTSTRPSRRTVRDEPARPDAHGEAGRRLAVRLGATRAPTSPSCSACTAGPARPRRALTKTYTLDERQRGLRRHARRRSIRGVITF